jgi:chromosome segregation ATPase
LYLNTLFNRQVKSAAVEQLKRRLAESDAARATLERHLAQEAAAKDAARSRLAAVEQAARDAEQAGADVERLREQLKVWIVNPLLSVVFFFSQTSP